MALSFRLWSSGEMEIDILLGRPWIAWRTGDQYSISHFESIDYGSWEGNSNRPIQFWPTSPFELLTPEFVAGTYVLGEFRREVVGLDPGGNEHAAVSEKEIGRLLRDRTELEEVAIEVAKRQRSLRRRMLEKMGLLRAPQMALPEGEPHIEIWMARYRSWARVVMGPRSADCDLQRTDFGGWSSNAGWLSSFRAGASEAAVYGVVTRDIEVALGCRLGSQSWSRPEWSRPGHGESLAELCSGTGFDIRDTELAVDFADASSSSFPPSQELQMWELSFDLALQRTMAAVIAMNMMNKEVPAADREWIDWVIHGVHAIQELRPNAGRVYRVRACPASQDIDDALPVAMRGRIRRPTQG